MSVADERTQLEEDGGGPRGSSADRTHLEHDRPETYQRVNLPDPLAERFEVVGAIPGGAEADLLVVSPRAGGDPRVVKLYRLRLEPPPEDVRARIAAADPAHVVRVSPPQTWRGVTYEVMEYCAAGSLRSLIDREGPRLAEALVRQVLVELHAALAHIHSPEIGLVHRDLKPANVLVRTREPLDLVLGDFGLSEFIGDHSKLFLSAKRTIAYAAPEATHGTINRKSDWWSVGMCVAEMLLGEHPILRELGPNATEQVVSQWIGDRPIPLEGVEGRWRSVCEGLLTKDVTDRWGEVEVSRWLAGEDPLVHRSSAAAAIAAPSVAPFGFRALTGDGFEAYDDPRLLAAAFGRHWDEALAIVSGARATRGEARRLATFVQDLGLSRAHRVLLSGGDDEPRLVRLRLALDPDCEPVFRGVDLAGDGLRRLVASAVSSEGSDAAATCAALLDAHVLSAHAGQPGRRDWASFDAEWIAADNAVTHEFGRLERRAGLPEPAASTSAAIRVQMLNAIVDPQGAERLSAAADAARDDEHACTQGWFKELADRSATEGLGLDAVVIAARPLAVADADQQERRREARERDRELREEVEALGREMTDTLATIPALDVPRPVRGDTDWIKGVGCLIWVGLTVCAAFLASQGVISKSFVGGSPLVLGPLAFLIAFAIYRSRQDRAEEEWVERCRQAAVRAAERSQVEARYTARMNELLPGEDR